MNIHCFTKLESIFAARAPRRLVLIRARCHIKHGHLYGHANGALLPPDARAATRVRASRRLLSGHGAPAATATRVWPESRRYRDEATKRRLSYFLRERFTVY